MKFIMDERVKHRLIGVAVIVALGAIFAPALLHKTDSPVEDKVNIAVTLPPKPVQPKPILVENKNEITQAIPNEVPSENDELLPPVTVALKPPKALSDIQIAMKQELIRAQKLKPNQKSNTSPSSASPSLSSKKNPGISTAKINANNGKYAVQLATFQQQSNAVTLINKLKNKGFKATINKVTSNNGPIYKVLVGQVQNKMQAQNLKEQLARIMHLQGFVVAIGAK